MEIIGAALGHRVDIGTDTAADGRVVVGGRDVVFLDRVLRDRRGQRRQAVRVQAERIVRADRIHGDVVVAAVLADGGKLAALAIGDHDARIEAHDVLDGSIGCRRRLDFATGHVGGYALVVRAEGLRQRAGGNRDPLEILRVLHAGVGVHGQIDRRLLRKLQVDVVLLGDRRAILGSADVERPTDTQPLRRIATIRTGGGGLGGAGRLVHDFYRGAGNRLAVAVQHATGDRRGSVLRKHWRGRQQCGNRQRQDLCADAATHQWFTPGGRSGLDSVKSARSVRLTAAQSHSRASSCAPASEALATRKTPISQFLRNSIRKILHFCNMLRK